GPGERAFPAAGGPRETGRRPPAEPARQPAEVEQSRHLAALAVLDADGSDAAEGGPQLARLEAVRRPAAPRSATLPGKVAHREARARAAGPTDPAQQGLGPEAAAVEEHRVHGRGQAVEEDAGRARPALPPDDDRAIGDEQRRQGAAEAIDRVARRPDDDLLPADLGGAVDAAAVHGDPRLETHRGGAHLDT